MLSVSDLNVRYGMHQALSSVSLQIDRDEIVVILGANGAGKSTLLSAIAGNCVGRVEGQVSLSGDSLIGLDTAQVVERGIAFVPEGRGVFSDLSVEENLQLGSFAEHARHNEQENHRRVLSLFPKLKERKKQIVRTMSGGEQQMVAIGRALMSAPSILMLDEPSLGLSPLLCKELFSSLKQVRDSGVGILLVEQNAKQSLSISDRGYLLGNGEIIGQDSAENLLNDPNVQAAYLGGAMATQTGVHTTVVKPRDESRVKPVATGGAGITPTVRAAETLSSNSLLSEDIDALVARASSLASQQSVSTAKMPMQIVKLSSAGQPKARQPVEPPAPDHASSNKVTPTSAPAVTAALDLPATQDSKVQALLAEFELAARNAASASKSSTSVRHTGHVHDESDDPNTLPHIPVYKKSLVTVYRRDNTGNLRKQDKS